jgi:PadR family transcriptional regulator, regulatory protein AphA
VSIRHAILGFLSWKPFTGYELKKIFADALSFHWSGSNNQIYGSLVDLHRKGALSITVQRQEKLPDRKVCTITEAGRAELRAWLLAEPELPVLRSPAHVRLAWSQSLTMEELDGLLASYQRQLSDQAHMCRETIRRAHAPQTGSARERVSAPVRSPREKLIWESIDENRAAFYERELAWARKLRAALKVIPQSGPGRR